jgi:hypothetical protein
MTLKVKHFYIIKREHICKYALSHIIFYKSKKKFNYALRASTPLAISINSLVMAS